MDTTDLCKRVVISHPRSGTMWLKHIMRCFEGGDIPCNYDGSLWIARRRYRQDKSEWDGFRILLLTRDPRDVIVSFWHFLVYRVNRCRVDLWPFTQSVQGLRWTISFLNDWGTVPFVRYEDLVESFEETVAFIVDFFRLKCDEKAMNAARSITPEFVGNTSRMRSGRVDRMIRRRPDMTIDDVRARHSRKAKVGDWVEHYTDEQKKEISEMMRSLNPRYGYS